MAPRSLFHKVTGGMFEKTNTGHTDANGRTIWRGPRGGLFVVKNGVKAAVAKSPAGSTRRTTMPAHSREISSASCAHHKKQYMFLERTLNYVKSHEKWLSAPGLKAYLENTPGYSGRLNTLFAEGIKSYEKNRAFYNRVVKTLSADLKYHQKAASAC